MQKNGKFILFTTDEFDNWLAETKFSRAVTLIQNHHTYSPAYGEFNGSNHFALLKSMERYHVTQRGFSEIAQNITTFPDGSLAVCRSLDRIPAGIKGANQAGVCIENLGNFDTGGDVMLPEHREAIIRTNALLCREFNLKPSTECIVYHHWYDLDSGTRTNGTGKTKSCPGTDFFGGNSVHSAQANFIPLVSAAFQTLTVAAHSQPIKTVEIVTANSLNVRAGAGTSFPVVKQLLRGVLVQIYEEAAGWCRIHPNEQQWVSGKYLQVVS